MKTQLNTRQALFAKNIALGKNGTQAAILAGYSKKSARFTASELLTNPHIKQHIEKIFKKAGLTDNMLAKTLKKSIDAGIGKDAKNSDTLKGLRMAFELKNMFPSSKQIEVSHDEFVYQRHLEKLEQMDIVELRKYNLKLLEETSFYLNKLESL